ncbi:MAG: NADP-dependent glyceraldehyde-3-phosphate dehydrogenase [Bacilli bacterium]
MNNSRTFGYYSGNMWQKSASGKTVPVKSPYLEGVMGEVQAMTQDEINGCIERAKIAQVEWGKLSTRVRADYLKQWATNLEKRKEEIAEVMMKEIAKPYNDCVKEVLRTAELIRFTADDAIHMHGESMRGDLYPGGTKNKIAVVERAPLGVVLAISPFNYPVNLSAAKIAPALVSGNACVFKPATQGSLSAAILVEALADVNIPYDVFHFVTGRGSEIGDYLVTHSDVDLISFTGGTETGMDIAKKAGMIPGIFELGGKDPAIVLDDADLKFTANQIVSGAFSYSGQRCTAIKRVLAKDETMDKLIPYIEEEMNKLTVGTPDKNPIIVPVIDSGSADYIVSLIDDALAKGATCLRGNERDGNLLQPTLLDNVTADMRIAWEEPFGPVLPLIRVQSVEEAIHMSNRSNFGLQASVFTNSIEHALHIAEQLDTGTVQINSRTERGPDHFPFLGTKHSGMGVQGIRGSIESMTRQKVTVMNIRSLQ